MKEQIRNFIFLQPFLKRENKTLFLPDHVKEMMLMLLIFCLFIVFIAALILEALKALEELSSYIRGGDYSTIIMFKLNIINL